VGTGGSVAGWGLVVMLPVAVSPWLAGRDEMQADPSVGPGGHRDAGRFGHVIATQHARLGATLGVQAVQFVDDVLTR
jgi:hypothetical protein